MAAQNPIEQVVESRPRDIDGLRPGAINLMVAGRVHGVTRIALLGGGGRRT